MINTIALCTTLPDPAPELWDRRPDPADCSAPCAFGSRAEWDSAVAPSPVTPSARKTAGMHRAHDQTTNHAFETCDLLSHAGESTGVYMGCDMIMRGG